MHAAVECAVGLPQRVCDLPWVRRQGFVARLHSQSPREPLVRQHLLSWHAGIIPLRPRRAQSHAPGRLKAHARGGRGVYVGVLLDVLTGRSRVHAVAPSPAIRNRWLLVLCLDHSGAGRVNMIINVRMTFFGVCGAWGEG